MALCGMLNRISHFPVRARPTPIPMSVRYFAFGTLLIMTASTKERAIEAKKRDDIAIFKLTNFRLKGQLNESTRHRFR